MSRSAVIGRRLSACCLLTLLGACDQGGDVQQQVQSGTAETLFRDAADEVGLDFRHFPGATGDYYFVETTSPGLALLDYDNDGDLDVYLPQGGMLGDGKTLSDALFPPPVRHWPGNRLFRNELIPGGRLAFTDVTEQAGVGHTGYGLGAAVGDYDNDGDTDIYLTNYGANVLYRNQGDGHFVDVTAAAGVDDPRWSTSASFLDYDRDGLLDLFVTNYVRFSVRENKICNDPGTGQRDYCGPASFSPVPDRLFRNLGDGRFADVSEQAGITRAYGPGLGVISADFNRDGWPDIYVANDGKANQHWLNRGDGSFEDVALMMGTAFNMSGSAEASMGVTAGDFDGDGDEDLFMTHLDGETNTLYLNDGQGSFLDATSHFRLAAPSRVFTGFGTRWFDYDNDGYLDLFIANGAVTVRHDQGKDAYPYREPNQLYRNEGGKGFRDVSRETGIAGMPQEVSRGMAVGDIDNDGDLDVLVSNSNGPVRLLLNGAVTGRHWLEVRLTGVESNRDGYGARVAVMTGDGHTLWRSAHTDGSYLSASDHRVHFGLGENTEIVTIGVEWPSGRRELWHGISPDSLVALKEGEGEAWQP